MLPLLAAGANLGLSLWGASRAADATAQSQLRDNKAMSDILGKQASLDELTRAAYGRSIMAEVSGQNKKVQDLQRMQEMMKLQGKADATMRLEGYNETAAMQMVMGAASGRLTSEGSVSVIMDKSESDYRWDQMWAADTETINLASLERDKLNIYESGWRQLQGAGEQMNLMRMGSQIGMDNTIMGIQKRHDSINMQQNKAFDDMIMGAGQSYLKNFGASGTKQLGKSIGGLLGGN